MPAMTPPPLQVPGHSISGEEFLRRALFHGREYCGRRTGRSVDIKYNNPPGHLSLYQCQYLHQRILTCKPYGHSGKQSLGMSQTFTDPRNNKTYHASWMGSAAGCLTTSTTGPSSARMPSPRPTMCRGKILPFNRSGLHRLWRIVPVG